MERFQALLSGQTGAMDKTKMLVIAAVMIVLGLGLQVMPTPGAPELECVSEGMPSSGWVDEDQGGCPVSTESYTEYREWESQAKWDNIVGLVLVLGGLGLGVTALVRGRSRRTAAQEAPPSA